MSWLPAMMFMHMLDDDEPDQPKQGQDPEEQYPTRCDAGYTRQEARNTTYALNRVLLDWDLSIATITPLRFYPNRDARFDRYKISI